MNKSVKRNKKKRGIGEGEPLIRPEPGDGRRVERGVRGPPFREGSSTEGYSGYTGRGGFRH